MDTESKQFPADELKQIDKADDPKIAPFREDGKTYRTPTWIWEVLFTRYRFKPYFLRHTCCNNATGFFPNCRLVPS